MDRSDGLSDSQKTRFPRRRGDGPKSGDSRISDGMFPPQARGWTLGKLLDDRYISVSPAGAGMDRLGR